MPTTGHVVVCGLDHLGLRTIGELRLQEAAVVAVGSTIDADSEDALAAAGIRVILGEQRSSRVLHQADIATASAIVLTSDDDLDNLNTALAAYELNPGIRIVLRMFDQELGARIPEVLPDAVALSSSALAAPGFVSAALDGEAGSSFELAGRRITSRQSTDTPTSTSSLAIARLGADRTVEMLPESDGTGPGLILIDIGPAGSTAAPHGIERPDRSRQLGRTLRGARGRVSSPDRNLIRFGVALLVLAIGSAIYFEFAAGITPLDAVSYVITLLTGAALPANVDAVSASAALRIYAIFLSVIGAAIVAVVYALITDALIRSRLLQTLGRRTVPNDMADHVIVAGLGTIGYRVALDLADRGVPVVAVEVAEDGRFVGATRAAGIPVYIGDARQPQVLDALRFAKARALIAATSDDLVNLSTALNARARRPDMRVVVRVYDPEFAVRIQRGFGIRFTRSVSHLAAPAFAAAAIGAEVVGSVPVGDKRVILFARVQVPDGSLLDGKLAASLDQTGAVRVLALSGGGTGDDGWDIASDAALNGGGSVVVAATRAGLGELLHLAGSPSA